MRMAKVGAVLAISAVLGLGLLAVHEGNASCSIWFTNAITSWTTNGEGSFGTLQTPNPLVRVDFTSASQVPWVLYGNETPGNSEHLATQDCIPGSYTISSSGNDSRNFTITGSLDAGYCQGLYELSCWDGTYWACAGAHDITIVHGNPPTCP